MNTHWLFQSSSLEGLEIKGEERRWFFLHPETGKSIVPNPKSNADFKNWLIDQLTNKEVELNNDRR